MAIRALWVALIVPSPSQSWRVSASERTRSRGCSSNRRLTFAVGPRSKSPSDIPPFENGADEGLIPVRPGLGAPLGNLIKDSRDIHALNTGALQFAKPDWHSFNAPFTPPDLEFRPLLAPFKRGPLHSHGFEPRAGAPVLLCSGRVFAICNGIQGLACPLARAFERQGRVGSKGGPALLAIGGATVAQGPGLATVGRGAQRQSRNPSSTAKSVCFPLVALM